MKYTSAYEFYRKHGSRFDFKINKATLTTDFPVHSHDFNELFIITKGTGKHIINQEEHALSPGDVFVIKDSTVYHGFKAPEQLELYNLSYSNTFLGEIGEDLLQMQGFQSLFALKTTHFNNKINNYIRLSINNRSEIITICENILSEFSANLSGYKTFIKSRFLEIIVILSREYEASSHITMPSQLEHLGKAMAYIERNYTNQIQLEDIAQKAAISERHLVRIFKEFFRFTPRKYINQLRMNKAIEMLKNDHPPIKEIAFLCGFNDVNYFSTRFMENVGKTPAQFRKQYLQY